MNYEGALQRLVGSLADAGAARDVRVLAAMSRVPRHLFVEDALRQRAYADDALPIGFGQTISKPSTVARMTEALALRPEHVVLEVGSGSGYQTAVLAQLAARVYAVERIAALVLRARSTLHRLGFHAAEVRHGDGSAGWAEAGPFDGILVAAAAGEVPRPLLDQLAVGGRLVVPVREGEGQSLRRIVRTAGGWQEETLEPCRFVPLVRPDTGRRGG